MKSTASCGKLRAGKGMRKQKMGCWYLLFMENSGLMYGNKLEFNAEVCSGKIENKRERINVCSVSGSGEEIQ